MEGSTEKLILKAKLLSTSGVMTLIIRGNGIPSIKQMILIREYFYYSKNMMRKSQVILTSIIGKKKNVAMLITSKAYF